MEAEMSKKCTLFWCEAHLEVKSVKAHHSRSTFGGGGVEKVHAVEARSALGSEHVQNTRGSDPLFDDSMAIPCRRNARRCGAKHVWKSNVPKSWGFE